PAFARAHGGPLTDEQVEALAKGLKVRWGSAESAGGTPPYVGGQRGGSEEGRRGFPRARARCPGLQGQGAGQSRQLRHQINDRAFLALISDQALRRVIITGRPDLGMPAYDGMKGREAEFRPLSSARIDDLVALLASWRKGSPAAEK